MFGEIADKSEHTSKLHQLVVSRLNTSKQSLWVIHTRGEDPISVYITDLTNRKLTALQVRKAVTSVRDVQTCTTRAEYDAVSHLTIFVWNTTEETKTLGDIASATQKTGMLGYTVDDEGEDE